MEKTEPICVGSQFKHLLQYYCHCDEKSIKDFSLREKDNSIDFRFHYPYKKLHGFGMGCFVALLTPCRSGRGLCGIKYSSSNRNSNPATSLKEQQTHRKI